MASFHSPYQPLIGIMSLSFTTLFSRLRHPDPYFSFSKLQAATLLDQIPRLRAVYSLPSGLSLRGLVIVPHPASWATCFE
jgi:hypothetical protein